MIKQFFVTLFYPWLAAVAFKAYEEYTMTDLYEQRVQSLGTVHALKMYRHNIVDFWNRALRKHWARILFTPWVFTAHPDLQEHGDKA